MNPNTKAITRHAVEGAISGLAATWVMTQVQVRFSLLLDRVWPKRSATGAQSSSSPTLEVANRVSRTLRKRNVSARHEELAGLLVHYGFGTSMGTVFGVLSKSKRLPLGSGVAFGSAVFLAADEVALPVLRLTPGPTQVPFRSHVEGLVAHLVYGATLGIAYRLVRMRRSEVTPYLESSEPTRAQAS